MKILLINPWIYDFAAFNLWSKPLGLLQVAEFLSAYTVDLHLIDCMDAFTPRGYNMGNFSKEILPTPPIVSRIKRRYGRYGISVDDFVDRIKTKERFDAILVTSIMTYWYPGAYEVIRICKELFSDTPVILGGIHATLNTQHASEKSNADFIYSGKMNDSIEGALKNCGLELKREHQTKPYYQLGLYQSMRYAPLLTSEGCPYRCHYCASGLLNNGVFVQRSADDVVKEIIELYKVGVRDFAFYDDALLYYSDNIKRILRETIRTGIQVRFHTPNGLHARFLDLDTAYLMKKAGFQTNRLSLETLNTQRQIETGAKVSNDELVEAVNNLKRAGFTKKNIGVYLMYGLPDQNMDEVWESVRFLKKLDVTIHLCEFSPLPGTNAWQELIEKEIITDDIDPLLTNNTVYSILFSGYRAEEINRLKDEVVRYNRWS